MEETPFLGSYGSTTDSSSDNNGLCTSQFCIIHDDFYDGYIDDDGFGDDDPHDSGNQPDERAEQKRTHLMNTICT